MHNRIQTAENYRYSTRTKCLNRYVQNYETAKTTRLINNRKCSNQRWSTLPIVDQSKIGLKEILTDIHQHFNNEIEDDRKSDSSIEYDYINPISLSIPQNLPQRHVSIATIYLQDEQWHQLELFIKHFSSCASLSNNLSVNSSTTHLIIDDSSTPNRCIFSKKIFQAVARHLFIVSIRWIEQCLIENNIVDETPFEIHGDSTMSTMHLARQSPINPLFSPLISFTIDCKSFQHVLTRHDLAELVLLSGGTLFDHESYISSEILIVLADSTTNRSQLEYRYKTLHRNIKYLTPGYLLKSIIYQKQQPFEDFEL